MHGTIWQRLTRPSWILAGCWAFCAAGQPETVHEARRDVPAAEPTRHGIRVTPGIARAFAGLWLSDILGGSTRIPVAKQDRLAALGALALLREVRDHGSEMRVFVERGLEMMAGERGRLKGEQAVEFASRSDILVQTLESMMGAFSDGARMTLTPAEQDEFDEGIERTRIWLTKFEARMGRWSNGELLEAEEPFDVAYEPIGAETEAPPSEPVRRAMAVADRLIRRQGPATWDRLVRATGTFLKFDDGQNAQADALLASFGRKAAEVMTPEWRQRYRRNQIELNLLRRIKVAKEPYLNRLRETSQELVAPLNALGQRLFEAVLELARPAQRAAARAELVGLAGEYGLKVNELRAIPTLEPR